MLTYRKTREGDWAVFGPAAELKAGAVTVRKKDGTRKTETVERVSKSFDVQGVPHAYGYIQRQERQGGCAACGRGGHLVEDMEDGLMKHYSCCDMPSD